MSRLQRQRFLGSESDQILKAATIGVVGLGGGGSHVVQQLNHLGVGGMVLVDPDRVEDTNTNRLIGATLKDVQEKAFKTDIAARMVRGLQPDCRLTLIADSWHAAIEPLRDCDVIVGAVDSFAVRDELERFNRANLIPYVDIGMDVHSLPGGEYLVSGQVILSLPDEPCLHCYGVLTEERLRQEAQRYGQAGSRPQVVWPNGVLASTAVGMVVQLLTPWHRMDRAGIYLEYDGNWGTVMQSPRLKHVKLPCPHHLPEGRGDPFFDVRKQADRLGRRTKKPAAPDVDHVVEPMPVARRSRLGRIFEYAFRPIRRLLISRGLRFRG